MGRAVGHLDAAGDGVWTLDARAIWVRREEARADG